MVHILHQGLLQVVLLKTPRPNYSLLHLIYLIIQMVILALLQLIMTMIVGGVQLVGLVVYPQFNGHFH